MGDPHRRPAREHVLAVGVRRGRQDGDARSRSTGRGEQLEVELGHRGEEFTGADERHGSGHGGESSLGAPTPRLTHCDTGARMTSRQRWTLVATIIGSGVVFLDGTIVNVALKQHRPAAAGDGDVGVSRARPTSSAATSRSSPPCSSCRAPCRTTTAGGACTPSGSCGFAVTSALCGLAPTLEWLVLFRLLQGATGALLVPGSLALITHAFDGPAARPRIRYLGVGDLGADAPRADRRRHHRRHDRLAVRVPPQRAAHRRRRCARPCAMSPSRATPRRTGRFDWLGARRRGPRGRRAVVRAHPRPGSSMGGPGGLDRDRRSASCRSSSSRSSWPRVRTRWSRWACSGRARSRRSTSRRSSSTARCTCNFIFQASAPAGRPRLHRPRGRRRSASRRGSC